MKNSKMWRKIQKEKESQRIHMKVSEPFSKAKKRRHLCLHYGGRPGGIVVGYCYSLLEKTNENENGASYVEIFR